jgi:hypothetical protein
MENLQNLIKSTPTDSVVGSQARFLFMRMLSLSEGFSYLKSIGWINSQRQEWLNVWNKRYISALETALILCVNNDQIPLLCQIGVSSEQYLLSYCCGLSIFSFHHHIPISCLR